MEPKLLNILPINSEVSSEGHLKVGGCDVVELSEKYGTPLYVYDESTIQVMAESFTKEFSNRYSNSRILYASKAYINPAIAKLAIQQGLGIDIVSGGELAVAASVDFPSEDIFFHGNNKSRSEIIEAIDYGVGRFVADSFYEIGLINEIAADRSKIQQVMLRLSPGIDGHTHKKTTTGILDTKFGFSIETGDALAAIKQVQSCENLDLTGIHFHLGSPIFEMEPYDIAIKSVIEFLSPLIKSGFDMRDFSPGGGFAVGYTAEKLPPTIGEYAETIAQALTESCEKFDIPYPRLLVEPGRSIVARAGIALYTVGAIKEIPGLRKYVSVDGGMGDNIRPALYDSQYAVILANKLNDDDKEVVRVVGKYCETGDILASRVQLPACSSGDLIALPVSGAYGMSMSSNYNLNPRPAVVMVSNGNSKIIRRRETYTDLMVCDEFE
mgnify:FL=1